MTRRRLASVWLRFPIVVALLALAALLTLGDHGPAWLLDTLDDEPETAS